MIPLKETRGFLSDFFPLTDLVLKQGGIRFRVGSMSMIPTLHPGDILDVEPVSQEQLQLNDLVVFQRNKSLICHRLVEWFDQNGTRQFVTKGDGVLHDTWTLSADQILGRVSRVTPLTFLGRRVWKAKMLVRMAWHYRRPQDQAQDPKWGPRWFCVRTLYDIGYRFHQKKGFFPRFGNFFGNLLTHTALGLAGPKELIRLNRGQWNLLADYWETDLDPQLNREEEDFLKRSGVASGGALVVGCGLGRESIVLAKRGFSVTAIDQSPAMIEKTRQNAEKENVFFKTLCGDITKALWPPESFVEHIPSFEWPPL